jgi:uncharacterized membrane protein YcjF (UPF0283 family)
MKMKTLSTTAFIHPVALIVLIITIVGVSVAVPLLRRLHQSHPVAAMIALILVAVALMVAAVMAIAEGIQIWRTKRRQTLETKGAQNKPNGE